MKNLKMKTLKTKSSLHSKKPDEPLAKEAAKAEVLKAINEGLRALEEGNIVPHKEALEFLRNIQKRIKK
jgi:predicted transcriptional regulator